MKKNTLMALVLGAGLSLASCHGILDIEPNNKLTPNDLFQTPNGARALLANIYRDLPVEDYMYMPGTTGSGGFNNPTGNIGLFWLANVCEEAIQSQWGEESPGYLIRADYFNHGYETLRNINLLKSFIPDLEISEQEKEELTGEAAFMTAFVYFYLAQKFGGVPLIRELQEYDPEYPEGLVVPRSTEKETWEYVMEQCDLAATYLPSTRDDRRATRWAALALKSRAALVAASVAKFGSLAPLEGEAVDLGLAGMKSADADLFYQHCIDASLEIIRNSPHALYRPSPADRFEAESNYKHIFSNPNQTEGEAIYIKGIVKEGSEFASSLNYYLEPYQTEGVGKKSPALNLVDAYEDYADLPGVRSHAPVRTRLNETFSNAGFNAAVTDYIKVHRDRPYDLFNGEAYGDPSRAKDARLWASVILPGTEWKNTKIIMQGGLIRTDGSEVYRVETRETGKDGHTYHSLGGEKHQVSGFWPGDGTHSMSGFLMKKMLNETMPAQYHKTTTDYIVFRYAEVLLNYAEAVCESGLGDQTEATRALNQVRRRAAHTNDIELTQENVRLERMVELAFENLRVWDLKRWRQLHTLYTNFSHEILVPMLDLREEDPALIFIRKSTIGTSLNGPANYSINEYYESVPRNAINQMIQNP
ncbi:MAG: RagB/SusD family nutrient uptake outer membrane protein [Bacteroides sp.]|nr:RagB/SusD family nutrient uptake outer membrane protein [Bacteroides sp.]